MLHMFDKVQWRQHNLFKALKKLHHTQIRKESKQYHIATASINIQYNGCTVSVQKMLHKSEARKQFSLSLVKDILQNL